MKDILWLLDETGKLKGKARRGWSIHKIRRAETTAGHIFHLALLVWVVGRKKENIDLERAIKIALVHDLCEIYSPDFTSYDAAAIDENKELTEEDIKNITPRKGGRPTTGQRKRMEDLKKKLEDRAVKKLVQGLDKSLGEEITSLWREYEEGSSTEARFVRQADKMINLYQGIDYYKKYGKIEYELWIRRAKEVIDDKQFVSLLKEIEKQFE